MSPLWKHYSMSPSVSLVSRKSSNSPGSRKPLPWTVTWISDESGDDGWSVYASQIEDLRPRLAYVYDVQISPSARVLYLKDESDLSHFGKEFSISPKYSHFMNWEWVSQRYDVVAVTPFLGADAWLNENCHWYFGWDCASALVLDSTHLSLGDAQETNLGNSSKTLDTLVRPC